MATRRPAEGDWFSIPVGDVVFLGRLARYSESEQLGLAYLFGPLQPSEGALEATRASATADAAFRVVRFTDQKLVSGEWPLLGSDSEFDRQQWPLPLFRIGLRSATRYDDDDLTLLGVVDLSLEDASDLPNDQMFLPDGLEGYLLHVSPPTGAPS